jgi:hypothetical protein
VMRWVESMGRVIRAGVGGLCAFSGGTADATTNNKNKTRRRRYGLGLVGMIRLGATSEAARAVFLKREAAAGQDRSIGREYSIDVVTWMIRGGGRTGWKSMLQK